MPRNRRIQRRRRDGSCGRGNRRQGGRGNQNRRRNGRRNEEEE